MNDNQKRIPEDAAAIPGRLAMPTADGFGNALGFVSGGAGVSRKEGEEDG